MKPTQMTSSSREMLKNDVMRENEESPSEPYYLVRRQGDDKVDEVGRVFQHFPKPAYTKGLLWFIFSGTAMLSAVVLPVHFFLLSKSPFILFRYPIWGELYYFILFFAALYHGLYRTKTILFDLGVIKYQKIVSYLLIILFLIPVGSLLFDLVIIILKYFF